MDTSIFRLKPVWHVSPAIQLALIIVLHILTIIVYAADYFNTGMILGYPAHWSIFFVPIYEEIIFRGFILFGLMTVFSRRTSFILSCTLFGLWHLKNVMYLDPYHLAHQVLYTTLIFAPITAYLAMKTKTIWPGVIVHYMNNLTAPLFILVFSLTP